MSLFRIVIIIFLFIATGCNGNEYFRFNRGMIILPEPIIAIVSPAEAIGVDTTPQFTISGIENGATVELYSDACITKVAEGISVGTSINLTSSTITKGIYQFYTRQKTSGGASSCLAYADYQLSGTPMVTEWLTTAPGESITLPLPSGFNYNALVDWGDGSKTMLTALGTTHIHTFAASGTQTITIMGTVEAWSFNDAGDKLKLYKVNELGDLGWKSMNAAFRGCTNLNTFVGVIDNKVTVLKEMFRQATLVNPDTSLWDTSSVTDMSTVFYLATSASPDVLNWDTSSVTTMANLFNGATSANPDVSDWDTSKVTDMSNMFKTATSATPDVSGWDTSKVTSMLGMFWGASIANPDVSNWDTSSVTNMSHMFRLALLANPNTSTWITSSVTDMSSMFRGASLANPDTSSWNFSNVSTMVSMFTVASISSLNYSIMLNRINATSALSSVTLAASPAKYNLDAAAARAILVGRGWTITDGGASGF